MVHLVLIPIEEVFFWQKASVLLISYSEEILSNVYLNLLVNHHPQQKLESFLWLSTLYFWYLFSFLSFPFLTVLWKTGTVF